MFRWLLIALLFLTFSGISYPGSLEAIHRVDKKEIVWILQMYGAIRKDIENQKLTESKKVANYCPPEAGDQPIRFIFRDKSKLAREFYYLRNAEDFVATDEYFYDTEGRLRLIFLTIKNKKGDVECQQTFIDIHRRVIQTKYQYDFKSKGIHREEILKGKAKLIANPIWDPESEFNMKLDCG